jgi:hypothetical protein
MLWRAQSEFPDVARGGFEILVAEAKASDNAP